jgi:short-subunit dehydrogenase
VNEHPWKTALVTGASSGIGEAMACLLASNGVRVVAVARREDRLRDLAAEMPQGTVEVLVADLTKKKHLARVAERAHDVDLLVNNAGFGTSGRFATSDPKRTQREIKLNVQAVVALTRAALDGMVARDRGWICNVSSIAGFQPAPSLAVYAATKAFVTSFTEGLHEELHGSGVSATALCPGLTRTEFQSVSSSEGQSHDYPDFAWMSAEEVASIGLTDTAGRIAVSVPGLANKAFVATTGVLPRGLVRRIAGMVQSQRQAFERQRDA